jgi:hypothetical protein
VLLVFNLPAARAAHTQSEVELLINATRRIVFMLIVLAVAGFVACSTTPSGQSEESWMEYLNFVRSLEADGPALEEGSEEERRAIERFQSLLSDFKAPDFSERIPEVYADELFFNDTIKTLYGAEDLQAYLTETAEAIDKGTVEFLDVVTSNGNYYFRWQMTIRFKKLARGEEKRSVGMSHIRFDADGKVVLHQDFWDSTAGLFEHVPALGWMLRSVKSRL